MMNKKGQTDFIGNILSIIPKPVLFILFIALMSFIVILISPVFNAFGVYCDSSGEVVKLEQSDFVTNILLKIPDASEIGGDDINPDGKGYKCTEYINGSNYLKKNSCNDCTLYQDLEVCNGDAYRKSDEDLIWLLRVVNCPIDDCRIPKGYYYEFDTGLYECIGDCSTQTLKSERDNKLKELGSVPMYNDGDSSSKDVFKFGCDKNLRVQPTIKGILIFDLKLWLVLILIMILLYGVINFRKKK